MGQGHQGSRYQSQLIANFHSCGARSGKPPQLPGNRTLLICSSVPGADILNRKAGAARRRTGHHDRTSPQGRHRRVAAGQELGGASPHPRAACAIRARGDEKALRPLEVPASYRSAWPEDVVPGNVARMYARMARELRDATHIPDHTEADPALHSSISSVPAAVETVPPLDHANASLAPGPPLLAVAEPAFLLLAFAFRALRVAVWNADAFDTLLFRCGFVLDGIECRVCRH